MDKLYFENKEICKKCGGECCKSMGCHFSPDDFLKNGGKITFEILKEKIEEGNISIDWWEGNPFNEERDIDRAYFLRMRNKNSKIVDPSWCGECILLKSNGCPLQFEERPKGARFLMCGEDKEGNPMCELEYEKDECVIEWYEYNDILEKLVDYFMK